MAELGRHAFEPLLPDMIRSRDLAERALVMGGGAGNEPPSNQAHEVTFVDGDRETRIVAVKVRLFCVTRNTNTPCRRGSKIPGKKPQPGFELKNSCDFNEMQCCRLVATF